MAENTRVEELIRLATDATLSFDSPGTLDQGVPEGGPVLQPSVGASPQLIPGPTAPQFFNGGPVQAQGPQAGVSQGAVAGGAAQQTGGQSISGPQMEAEINRLLTQHPEKFDQVKRAFEQAVADGVATPEQFDQLEQLILAAANNPEVWPQVRQKIIELGLGSEETVPQDMVPGLIFSMLAGIRAYKAPQVKAATTQVDGSPIEGGDAQAPTQGAPAPGGQTTPQAVGQAPVRAFNTGGFSGRSRNSDGSISAILHENEFVIPERVVRAKGTDFFEKMIAPEDSKGSKNA